MNTCRGLALGLAFAGSVFAADPESVIKQMTIYKNGDELNCSPVSVEIYKEAEKYFASVKNIENKNCKYVIAVLPEERCYSVEIKDNIAPGVVGYVSSGEATLVKANKDDVRDEHYWSFALIDYSKRTTHDARESVYDVTETGLKRGSVFASVYRQPIKQK